MVFHIQPTRVFFLLVRPNRVTSPRQTQRGLLYDIVVIGAGIVGTATAYRLKERQPDLRLCIIDKEEGPARHQSGRNSGVIHSGIYYQPGSHKALHCRKGYEALLRFCDQHEVRYDICGKIIAAVNDEEAARLSGIMEKGIANGLTGLRRLSREEALEIEPHVHCASAILVPQTGIISYREVAEKQLELACNTGAETRFSTALTGLQRVGNETIVQTTAGDIRCKTAINCTGLYADKTAAMTHQSEGLKVLPFRGEFYELVPERQYLVRNLIYPVPNPAFPFLGVHFTRMIEGGIEAGPNAVLAFRREGYSRWDVNVPELLEMLAFPGLHRIAEKYWRIELEELRRSFFKSAFVKALQRLIPEIRDEDLVRARSGVRAMACQKDGQLVDDFLIRRSEGVVHVLNAPSPAATASLAVGDWIADVVLAG